MDVSGFRNVCFHSPNTTFSQPAWLGVELERVPLVTGWGNRQNVNLLGESRDEMVKTEMQRSANSLGTKVQPTDFCIFKNTLGNLCFFKAIYPFPKVRVFGGGQKTGGPARFPWKNGTIYHGIIKKNRFAGLPTFWSFIKQIDGWKFPHKLKGSSDPTTAVEPFFFGGGASMVMSDYMFGSGSRISVYFRICSSLVADYPNTCENFT